MQMRIVKCNFGYYKIDFVGYHISKEGLRTIQNNISPTLDFEVPSDAVAIGRFKGMADYYRDFFIKFRR